MKFIMTGLDVRNVITYTDLSTSALTFNLCSPDLSEPYIIKCSSTVILCVNKIKMALCLSIAQVKMQIGIRLNGYHLKNKYDRNHYAFKTKIVQ